MATHGMIDLETLSTRPDATVLTVGAIKFDPYTGREGGLSAGYSLSLFAESTSGFTISAERTSAPKELPEDIGAQGAYLLLDEIERGGVVDSSHQVLILQLMVMASEDVSKVL